MLKIKVPFDPKLKHHLIIALSLSLWIFIFLFFTEPLDVNQLSTSEKLLFLPIYGIVGAIAYLALMPLQHWLFNRNNENWYFQTEIIIFIIFILGGLIVTRLVYLYIIVPNEPNPYSLRYFTLSIYLPAMVTILPIVIAGRWAFGKYKDKKLADEKIEIQGEGTYEGLKLLYNDLIVIKADDNYIDVQYLDNSILKKQLIRNKLSKISEDFPQLLRTHRSYLINPYHFKKWEMIKGKLHIVLSNEIIIPVSKTYSENVKGTLNN